MKWTRSGALCGAALMLIYPAVAAKAGDPTGVWLTAERESQIRIAPCGEDANAQAMPAKPGAPAQTGSTVANRAPSTTPGPGANQARAAAPKPGNGRESLANAKTPLCGTLAWSREPLDPQTGRPRTDTNNPDPALRSRPLIGSPILLLMTPGKKPDVWEGQVYNPLDGKTHSVSMILENPNSLKIEGCVLGGWFCGSSTWTRVN